MKTKLLLLTLISLPLVSQARLGDTYQSLTNRIGAGITITGPLKDEVPGAVDYFFEKNGIKESVSFWHGVSVYETYTKTEKDMTGDYKRFSKEEVRGVLENNALGGSWSINDNYGGGVGHLEWWAAGQTSAALNPPMEGIWADGSITIWTAKYEATRKAATAAQDKKKLGGF